MENYLFFIGYGVVAFAVVVIGITMKKAQKKAELERERLKKLAIKRAEAAKSVKKIQWTNQFIVDEGVIDEDHRTLFGLINKFNEGIIGFRKPEQMIPHLKAFTEYTQTHFKREEEMQRKSNFPFFDDHRKEHATLIEKLKGLSHKALAANEDNITNVAVEIAKFLQDWLTGHVIENDLPLKPYMERIREETQDMPKLAMEANVTSDSSEAPAGTTVH
ncbi:MAG: hemerythrin family protein [Rhodospirillales bacterium]|nr:hemerythrin family protein [Alphaproteobacteria bacterium]MBL6947045.1 hemerythrin family protein [Rhodospirillales bacterium]